MAGTANTVTELSNSGTVLSGGSGYTTQAGLVSFSLAIDGSGNVWAPNTGSNDVIELSSAGAALSGATGFTGGGLANPWAVAIDASGNAWLLDSKQASSGNGTTVVKLSPTGASLGGTTGIIDAGLQTPAAIAMDGAGNVWIANAGSSPGYANSAITELSNAGVLVSPNNYLGGSLNSPTGIAVDGSGNVWASNLIGNSVTELIGAGVPVVTPLSAGVKTNTLGTRP